MATYCESIGLKVDDKIRFIGPDDHPHYKVGDVLMLIKDDGTSAPYFLRRDGLCMMFDLKRQWEKVKHW